MHRNAEIIRRGYQAFNTADMTTLTELFDENASWHTPGRGSIAGDRVGRDAVFAQFGRYGGETGGTFKAELRHVLADDEGRVVGIHHNSGVRNGQQLDVDCCIVFEIRSGRITSGREHFYNLHAWEQFWAEPNESRLCRAGTGGSIMPPPNNRMQRTAPGVSSRVLSAHFQKEPRR